MSDSQPTQPLTGFELDNIEGRWQRYVALRDEDSMETSVHDVPDLLAEVDRLRSTLTALGRNERAAANRALELQEERDRLNAQVQDYHKSAYEHTAKFERQHERLMEAEATIAAARELHEPAQSSAWNYLYCASGCGARPLQGPDPWPCNTAEALGMSPDE